MERKIAYDYCTSACADLSSPCSFLFSVQLFLKESAETQLENARATTLKAVVILLQKMVMVMIYMYVSKYVHWDT